MAAVPEHLPATHHGTAIAVDGRAALIRGASGAGKSDLALRCITLPPSLLLPSPAELVADDRVVMASDGNRLRIEPPSTLAGRMEVRGLGIVAMPYVPWAFVELVVDLTAPAEVDRLPDPPLRTNLLGINLPLLRLAPFEASAPIKLLLALETCKD
ncbi:HPr kinase/phosphatase C-terminal domain-containing protein [Hyphomicrobium sulfonivorans]|uniref:HPr kinase/phosphorylase n=1 Tax=Hyphomicrobium sulfonivorans TaxID=121290 RepID=UPI0030B829DE